MKLLHLSDLHIGKWVNGYQMLEDQNYIFDQILSIADTEKPDAVLIAGDIYDKPVPPAQAVECFDIFLSGLSDRVKDIFIISGNHDSPERLKFGSRLMDRSGVHICAVYEGPVKAFTAEDEYGPLYFYLLPFVKPSGIRRFLSQETAGDSEEEDPDHNCREVITYHDAARIAVREMNIDPAQRNILVAHQFVTGALRSDSEELSVGGMDNVDAGIFEVFDYTALGHIHRPQNVGSEYIRYCGSPLKYSFSESRYDKSVTIVELKEKGSRSVRQVPLVPLHDMAEIRGRYDELVNKSFYENTTWQEDYMHITLTDEEDVLNAAARLQTIYHNLMKLDYDNARTRAQGNMQDPGEMEDRSPFELFSDFYEQQNVLPLSQQQGAFMRELIGKIWEEQE